MKSCKLSLFFFAAGLYVIACKTPAAIRAPAVSGFILVWADEFNNAGPPDPANWRYENGFVRNNERQWYQPQNAWCEKGLLIIEGRKERKLNPGYEAGSTHWAKSRQFSEYTSACIKTSTKHTWLYGRFEMRGRIDTRDGLWPAFWTLGSARAWPGGGEVDIMEYYRGMHLANLIWGGGENGKYTGISLKTPITQLPHDWSLKFHTWRMDWDSLFIRLYMDDVLLQETNLNNTFNRNAQNEKAANPFREPHYLLLDLAIGGNQGGGREGGENLPGGNPELTKFPSQFEVDYVRVYQRQP